MTALHRRQRSVRSVRLPARRTPHGPTPAADMATARQLARLQATVDFLGGELSALLEKHKRLERRVKELTR